MNSGAVAAVIVNDRDGKQFQYLATTRVVNVLCFRFQKSSHCMLLCFSVLAFPFQTIGFFRGTLGANETSGRPNRVSIPIIGISDTDGTILSSSIGQEINLYFPIDGGAYGTQNGTSMAYVYMMIA
jgi:hypothetical protein